MNGERTTAVISAKSMSAASLSDADLGRTAAGRAVYAGAAHHLL